VGAPKSHPKRQAFWGPRREREEEKKILHSYLT
jgi:hypothetical protein